MAPRALYLEKPSGCDGVHVGGNILARDLELLKALGAAGVFPTGSRFEDIVEFIWRM